MSTKVEVYASPGWEAEVDTDWAEGLFAVFLRSARGRRRGPKGATRVIPKRERDVDDGVILLTVRKDEPPDSESQGGTGQKTNRSSETRRTKKPRKLDDRTAKMGPEMLPRPSTKRKAKPTPVPPPRPTTLRAAVPPPPPSGPAHGRPTVPSAPAGKAMGGGMGAFLTEMATLVKYGHVAQVRAEVDRKLVQWPEDLGFRRLMIDFFQERGLVSETVDGLFGLATIYFDRREMAQMRECLDEVLRLDPQSRRARRMRDLLDKRPGRRPTTGG